MNILALLPLDIVNHQSTASRLGRMTRLAAKRHEGLANEGLTDEGFHCPPKMAFLPTNGTGKTRNRNQ